MSAPLCYFSSCFKFTLKLTPFASLLLLIGCFDFSATETNSTQNPSAYQDTVIQGFAVNSVIENGLIQAYQIVHSNDGSTVSKIPLGLTVRTDSSGFFQLHLPDTTQVDSVLLKLSADEHTYMRCDAVSGCHHKTSNITTRFGEKFLLDTDFEISAALPTIQSEHINKVNISTLSHLSVSRAKSLEGGLSPDNIDDSIAYFEITLGLNSGALQLMPTNLSKLDDYSELNQTAVETSLIASALIALLNTPDWASISEIVNHAASQVAITGSLSAMNLGALPEVSLDDLFYQASENTLALLKNTNNPQHKNTLHIIATEFDAAYKLTTLAPEIIAPIMIEKQPISITVNQGEPASFTVLAVGGGDLTYQWYFNDKAIPKANNATFTVDLTEQSHIGTYNVIISNPVGSQTSLSALLSVREIQHREEPNSPPETHNDSVEVFEDTTTTLTVLDNDSDPDGDQIAIIQANILEGSGDITIKTIETEADAEHSVLIFTPELNKNNPTRIQYTVIDSHGAQSTAQVFISILPINDAPEPKNDQASMNEDTQLTIDVLANDIDSDNDSLSISSASSFDGHININSNNTLTFKPESNFYGVANITYIVSDGHGAIANSSVSVNVLATNDAPVAVDDTASTNEDTAVSINVLANDQDIDSDVLHITHAVATSGTVSIIDKNKLFFTPEIDSSTTTLVTYSISDGNGGTATASVSISIFAINDAPDLNDDIAITNEDIPIIIDVLNNDSDRDNDILSLTEAHVIGVGGLVSINQNQSLTFVPSPDFNGEVTLSYSVTDQHGGTATGRVSISIKPINDKPVLLNHQTSTDQDIGIDIHALAGAFDIDDENLIINATSTRYGTTEIKDAGMLTYMPPPTFSGEDTITYNVADEHGGTTSALITVKVNAVQKVSSIELNWGIPTKRNDGSPLDENDIKGYLLAYGTNSMQLAQSEFINGARTLNYTIEDLNQGTYYFAISTMTMDDIQGAFSEQIKIDID